MLVASTHSGNIGSVARCMKTMGLSQLVLVDPQIMIDEQCLALAAGAQDIILNCQIVKDLNTAIASCQLVLATSARVRHLDNTIVTPKQSAELVIQHLQQYNSNEIAIVFGPERIGLDNQQLLNSQYHIVIPANPKYSSLNLAMATQIICYEIFQYYLNQQQNMTNLVVAEKDIEYPTKEELEFFYQKTETVFRKLGFIQNEALLMKLKRMYNRTHLEKNELNILLGMLSAIEKHKI